MKEGMTERSEFGRTRTNCSCTTCVRNCRYMPGMLIPADLERLIPKGVDPFRWAEVHLRASPGALAMRREQLFRIPTLVPALKPEGGCIFLDPNNSCTIHKDAPFGCAFYDCAPETESRQHMTMEAMTEIAEAQTDLRSLYCQLHIHLLYKGLEAQGPEHLRQLMLEEENAELGSV